MRRENDLKDQNHANHIQFGFIDGVLKTDTCDLKIDTCDLKIDVLEQEEGPLETRLFKAWSKETPLMTGRLSLTLTLTLTLTLRNLLITVRLSRLWPGYRPVGSLPVEATGSFGNGRHRVQKLLRPWVGVGGLLYY